MAKKNTKKRNKMEDESIWKNILVSIDDKRVKNAIGITIIAFAALMLISFISFFFSGGIDQSKLDIDTMQYIMDSDITVSNIAGKFGASIAEFFINDGFGVASFIFVYLLAVVGATCLGYKKISLKKSMLVGVFGLVWFALFFAFVFDSFSSDIFVFPGGSYGFFMQKWLNALIGRVGTFFVIAVSFVIIMTFSFQNFFPAVKRFINFSRINTGEKDVMADEKDEVTPNMSFEEDDFIGNIPEEEPSMDIQPDEDFNKAIDLDPLPNGIQDEDLLNNLLDQEEAPVEEIFNEEIYKEEASKDEIELVIENEGVEEEHVKKNIEPIEDFDPTLELSNYKFPDINLLEAHDANNKKVTPEELEDNKKRIVETLRNYKIEIVKIMATIGPTVTLYEIVPAPGVRISKIKNLEDDIALSLAALGIRIIAPIPGKGTVGIEVPNLKPEIVSMKAIISSKKFQESDYALPVALGKTISNDTFTFDLAKMPHLLVAGATGQGKSVGLNAIITSLLYKKHPSQLKFVMVDPKKVELSIYSVIEKHFLAKLPDTEDAIITDVGKVVATLNSLCIEMDNRYDLLKKAHVRNIKEYNSKFVKRKLNPDKGHKYLPYIVVVVDEFADLIMTAGKEVEQPIARIAQLARAVGIHMIIATQRPSTNIITGVIKANFPARIAFKVASMIDSRTILDSPGANQLIGRGDMLFTSSSDLTRVQCAFVDTPEVDAITEHISEQQSYVSAFMLPEYVPEASGSDINDVDLGARDPLFEDAARLVVGSQQGSTSSIQRRFSIGYNRAGRIIDQLESAGVVGPFEGSKARQVLVPDEYSLEQMLSVI